MTPELYEHLKGRAHMRLESHEVRALFDYVDRLIALHQKGSHCDPVHIFEEFSKWSSTHPIDNYGRYDAFNAGYRLGRIEFPLEEPNDFEAGATQKESES